MIDREKEKKLFTNESTIYGPVESWRFGLSVGVDPIYEVSTCSFNCLYCQLGHIQKITTEPKEFVSTKKIMTDFESFLLKEQDFDVLTYSGSGEPTLAKNLAEIIDGLRKLAPNKKQIILSNATELHREDILAALQKLDRVILKVDSLEEKLFQMINRPAPGVDLKKIKAGILNFKKHYQGPIDIQTMFMPLNSKQLDDYAHFINEVGPDTVQLNTPKRPYPLSWHRENRGNHHKIFDYDIRDLKVLEREQASVIEEKLKSLTSTNILSVYRD